MKHLDESELVALRDGGGGQEAERHLETCGACRQSLGLLQRRRVLVAESLSALDEPFDVARARAAVRARIPAGHVPHRRTARSALGRAAGVILFLGAAGAAYAMPGSPVRSWLSRSGRPAEPEAAATGTHTPPAPAETAVRMDMGSGPARIVLDGVRAGATIEVTLVGGTAAAVTAPRGTRFTTSGGRIEADVAPGTVRVELPRDVLPSTLEISGRVYLRNTRTGLQIPGPVTRRTDGSIRFTVPNG